VRDGREILHGIVVQFFAVQPRIGGERETVDEQGVAVGRRMGDQFGGDDGAGAGAIVDDDGLAERGRQFRGERARQRVVETAGTTILIGLVG
jgi:hypothetical protein